jgi:ATP-dependent Clp protease adaptor protein ClpS
MNDNDTTTVKPSIINELGFDNMTEDVYKLIIHNDHVNDMLHVVLALVAICKLTPDESAAIMMEAHINGKAVAKTGTLELMNNMKMALNDMNIEATVEV